MTQAGLHPPLVIRDDPVEGYMVCADEPIMDMTLLCEYVGEVRQAFVQMVNGEVFCYYIWGS